MFRRILFVAVCILVVVSNGAASPALKTAPLMSENDTRQLADSIMALVVEDKVDDAFAKLKPHWPIPSGEIDSIALKTIAMRDTAGGRFGKSLGYAFVREDKVADFIIRYTYAEKRENHALHWVFYFYRPKSA